METIDERQAEQPQFASLTADLLIRRSEAHTNVKYLHVPSVTSDILARKGDAQPWISIGTGKADIVVAKLEAIDGVRAAEVERKKNTVESSAGTADRSRFEAEIADLEDQLGRLRRNGAAEIEAAKLETIKELSAAQAQWQEKTATSLAELTAEYRAAETALMEDWATERSKLEADIADLQKQLERLRRSADADIAALKLGACKAMEAAEVQWQEKTARSVAALTVRCQDAETALASALAADTAKAEPDYAEIHRLNHDVHSLKRSLAEREAHLEQALARLEAVRLETAASSSANSWHPLSNRSGEIGGEEPKESDHLWRDALILFFAVMGIVLCWPAIEQLIKSANVLDAPPQQRVVMPAAPTPAPPTKPDYPKATVARGVNMRADHAVGAEVLTTLKAGAQVEIIGKSGNWVQVEIAGAGGKILQGWVYASYLDASSSTTPP